MSLPLIPPFKTKVVEPLYFRSADQRAEKIKEAHYNLFKIHSDWVIIDLLTDSGTSAMSEQQWAEIMLADESYAGSESFFKLIRAIKEITGFDYIAPTHQGRAAENILFSATITEGQVVPGNAHFDTTKGHIEFRKAQAIDCTIKEAFQTAIDHPFKGNIDVEKLKAVITKYGKASIPFIAITVTCNTVGGQPVSLANITEVKRLAYEYGIPVYMDIARYAENAYFIKTREAAYHDWSIRDIIKEMFAGVQAVWMSSKKDALVNIGGFIATSNEHLFEKISQFTIIYEGYITYGGMSGRAMGALAQGLYEGIEFDYLNDRINQVEYLGEKLRAAGVPVQYPFGGHAIYIDARKFFPNVPKEQYPAQLLAIELYISAGVRGVEVGALLTDSDPTTGLDRLPKIDLLRLAIPRRVYTNQHLAYVAEAIIEIHKKRDTFKTGFRIKKQAPIMRHFTIELERVE